MINGIAHIIIEKHTGSELAVESSMIVARTKLVTYLEEGIDVYIIHERQYLIGRFKN